MYNGQCISLSVGCPIGYTEVNMECIRCISPCADCDGTPNFCKVCDNTQGRSILYRGECLAECPAGTVLKGGTCVECQNPDMCAVCDPDDLGLCRECIPPFVLHLGQCITGCPGGFSETSSGSGCYSIDTKDVGMFYFPFLIAAFFGCLIALCGTCKKTPGRTKYISS